MPDNFYTLAPVDQQVALAYAQTLFAEWLKKNPNRAPDASPHLEFLKFLKFLKFLQNSVSVAQDLRYRSTGSLDPLR